MGLEDIGDLCINVVLSKLEAKDTAAVACVSRKFRDSASVSSLWLKFCSEELDLFTPLDPQGNSAPSFKDAYRLWREAFSTYPWPLVKRVKKCWGQLKKWLATNFPEAETTLQRGATEAELEELEKSLQVKLPLPTRILYRFYNGQNITDPDVSNDGPLSILGLMGGYSFYQHFVNVYLLPIRHVILYTKKTIRQLGFAIRSKYIVVAVSAYNEKLFFLNCNDGQLYVGSRNVIIDGEMIPCVPKSLIRLVNDPNDFQQQDSMLLWLEEHGRRLQNGIIGMREEGNVRYINLFSEKSPLCSTAVTNGVQVRASAAFVPEMSDLQNETNKYLFAYSIRMCLLSTGCIVEGMSFGSCQLYWRHWIIRANDNVVSDVNGEAVIGKFPLLYPGGKEFVYESCTPLSSSQGSVEGFFTFVPGSLADPKGQHFKVEVALFPLQLPDYIF